MAAAPVGRVRPQPSTAGAAGCCCCGLARGLRGARKAVSCCCCCCGSARRHRVGVWECAPHFTRCVHGLTEAVQRSAGCPPLSRALVGSRGHRRRLDHARGASKLKDAASINHRSRLQHHHHREAGRGMVSSVEAERGSTGQGGWEDPAERCARARLGCQAAQPRVLHWGSLATRYQSETSQVPRTSPSGFRLYCLPVAMSVSTSFTMSTSTCVAGGRNLVRTPRRAVVQSSRRQQPAAAMAAAAAAQRPREQKQQRLQQRRRLQRRQQRRRRSPPVPSPARRTSAHQSPQGTARPCRATAVHSSFGTGRPDCAALPNNRRRALDPRPAPRPATAPAVQGHGATRSRGHAVAEEDACI